MAASQRSFRQQTLKTAQPDESRDAKLTVVCHKDRPAPSSVRLHKVLEAWPHLAAACKGAP